MSHEAIKIGTVVGNTSPQEFTFYLRSFAAKLGDLVNVPIEIPSDTSSERQKVKVWGRITELQRFNPFLPAEVGVELAEEGLELIDTVLSTSRDQIEGKVLVLGRTTPAAPTKLVPLNYPVQPGAVVELPPQDLVRRILLGEEKDTRRIRIGSLIGRSSIEVSLRANVIVARHMAILAMTGGGKTVAARRVIRELLDAKYPLVILDPHGDYLGFWEKRELFPDNDIRLFYPSITVNERNRDVIAYLVYKMTQGFSDAQLERFHEAMERVEIGESEDSLSVPSFIERLLSKLDEMNPARHPGTTPAVKRQLRFVRRQMTAMERSNEALRTRLQGVPFEPMPDPCTCPDQFVRPGQATVIYLGGYDHLTQSTLVSLVLKQLFDVRASMRNQIPPFLTVVEEAHNFIPSRGEGQAETPSVEIIRKVITEGRKFGVGLLLISQRPSRLDETTLSQCNTFLVFRLVNPRDQSFVEKVMENLSKADGRLLPGFGAGQGIVSGQAVRFPLVVKVDFDEDLVTRAIGDEDFLEAVLSWENSPEGVAAQRGATMAKELDQVPLDG